MSEKTTTAEIQVHLVHPGNAARDYHLPEGSTLADLLRRSGSPMARINLASRSFRPPEKSRISPFTGSWLMKWRG